MRQLLRPQWPIVWVVLIFVVAFGLAAANFWRRGALLIGIGVGVARGAAVGAHRGPCRAAGGAQQGD